MKHSTLMILLGVVLLSCKKEKVIVSAVLTDCPAGSTCTYSYYDNASFKRPQQLAAGTSRVFYYINLSNNNNCSIFRHLYFTTSLNNNDFVINASQIAAGQATYNYSCACCYIGYVPKAMGGEIKGKKTGPNQWLINATIVLADPGNNPVDTLRVNQYFNLSKLP